MGEEVDYMSDEFLKNCEDSANDVRPGLIKTHRELREHHLIKKKNSALKTEKKTREVLQAELLEESLKQPINATNKGFAMLEKMGFKSGMGLGKNNSGIKEPIGLNIKNDKIGLGHKMANKVKLQSKRENKVKEINEDDFRAFLSKKNKDKETISDFKKSQRICRELDLKLDKSAPQETWFWPEELTGLELGKAEDTSEENNDSDDIELELSDAEKLEMLTKYLRENYFYCIWCKIQYSDEKDMQDCPGPARDYH